MNQILRPLATHILEQLKFSDEEASYGHLQTAHGPLPLRRLDVDGRITGLIYRATISQTFENNFAEPLEATYIFPLPLRAGVTRFVMKVADRTIEGVLKEREQARQIYDAAIRAGHRAAIAEEDRPEVFTMRAGNIMPGEQVTVELEMAGPLSFADGQATFRFPLVIAPRYIPGRALDGASVGSGTAVDTDAVPDASRITPPVLLPGQPNPVQLGLRMTLDPAGLEFEELCCSLHEMQLSQDGQLSTVSLQPGTERLDRDFILRLRTREDSVQSALSVVRDPEHEEGTFALTVVPPSLEKAGVRPRDVVLLLDRSGSMEGWKMIAARRAAARIIDSLTPHDRFGVILFDDRLEEPAPSAGKLVEATDRARFKAVEFMARVEARGGTEISPALTRSLEYLAQSGLDRERIIVFVTDGQVGNEDQLLRQVQQKAQGCRIFSIGIDRCVNVGLLERLAGYGGGSFELVESEDRLDEVLLNVHRRVGAPVVKGVTLDHAHWDATPAPADLFPGVPVRLFGRFRGTLPQQVTVKGVAADGSAWQQTVAPVNTQDPAARTLWARARVLDMEHEFMAGRQDPGMTQKITQFSLQYGVLCRFTAFVAVDRHEVVNKGGQQHQVTQAVAAASGWGEGTRGGAGIFKATAAFGADPFGAPAVDPFASAGADPFGTPAADPFGAPAGYADPFGAPAADPFACAADPFGAPSADPFACPAPAMDPFGGGNPFGDPFACPEPELCLDMDLGGELPDMVREMPAEPYHERAKTGSLAPPPPSLAPPMPKPVAQRAPGVAKKLKKEQADPNRLAEQVDKLTRELEGTPDYDLVDALMAEILVLLEETGAEARLVETGRQLRGGTDYAAMAAWLVEVRQDRGLPETPAAESTRGGWWKR